MSGEESLGSSSGLRVLIPQRWAQEGFTRLVLDFLGSNITMLSYLVIIFYSPLFESCFGCCSFPLCLEDNDYLDSSWQIVDSYVADEIYGTGSGQQWVAKPLVQKLGASMEDEDAKISSTSGVPSAVLTRFWIVPLGGVQ